MNNAGVVHVAAVSRERTPRNSLPARAFVISLTASYIL